MRQTKFEDLQPSPHMLCNHQIREAISVFVTHFIFESKVNLSKQYTVQAHAARLHYLIQIANS